MGFAIPAALGLQVSSGRRPLVLVGDGAFQVTGPEISHAGALGCNPIVVLLNNNRLEAGDGGNEPDIGALDLGQARSPVGARMRPGQDHARLRLPLGGETAFRRHVRAQGCAGAGPISSSLALASTEFTTCEFSK